VDVKNRGKIGAKRYLTRRPFNYGGLDRHGVAFYGVVRVVKSNSIEKGNTPIAPAIQAPDAPLPTNS